MTTLLFVQASPKGRESESIRIAEAYVSALGAADPGLEVDVIELWEEGLPDFDGDRVAAKMQVVMGQEQTAAQKSIWQRVEEVSNRFARADRYVFAIPMWNGSIPYRLKHYIDVVHQPRITFGIDGNGYFGLLENKRATLVMTSGAYADDRPSPAWGVDHQSTYMKAWLNQAGVKNIDEIQYRASARNADPKNGLENAIRRAKEMATANVTA